MLELGNLELPCTKVVSRHMRLVLRGEPHVARASGLYVIAHLHLSPGTVPMRWLQCQYSCLLLLLWQVLLLCKRHSCNEKLRLYRVHIGTVLMLMNLDINRRLHINPFFT